jgi:hypothetical protein
MILQDSLFWLWPPLGNRMGTLGMSKPWVGSWLDLLTWPLDDMEMAESGWSGVRGDPLAANEEIRVIGQIGLRLHESEAVVAGNATGELLEQGLDREEAMYWDDWGMVKTVENYISKCLIF